MLQLCLMHWLPESPRVLLLRGQVEEARLVLQQINKHQDARIIELKLRVAQYTAETSTVLQRNMKPLQRFKMLFKTPKYRRSIISVSLLQLFGQLTGFNTASYCLRGLRPKAYASAPLLCRATLRSTRALQSRAWGSHPLIRQCILPGESYEHGRGLIAKFLGFNIIDKLGRRGLMMWFVPVMVSVHKSDSCIVDPSSLDWCGILSLFTTCVNPPAADSTSITTTIARWSVLSLAV